jgi:hypothetical protein
MESLVNLDIAAAFLLSCTLSFTFRRGPDVTPCKDSFENCQQNVNNNSAKQSEREKKGDSGTWRQINAIAQVRETVQNPA